MTYCICLILVSTLIKICNITLYVYKRPLEGATNKC